VSAATAYNQSKAGVLWAVVDLPAPLSGLDPATQAFADAVASFQTSKGLASDGKLGPSTLAAMKGPAVPLVTAPAGSPAAALIAVCEAEHAKHVREVGGMNQGPDVEKYQKIVGLSPGSPWCSAFVTWCYATSQGLSTPPSWGSGSAITVWQRGTRKMLAQGYTTPLQSNFRDKVRPGMIWVRAKDGPGAIAARSGTWLQGHCGIVISVDSEGFCTIEGNTNGAGSREGDGVYLKTHKWSYEIDIIRTIGWFDPEFVGRVLRLS